MKQEQIHTVHQSNCPYGTYQRATSGWLIMEITPLKLIRLMRGKIDKKHKRGREKRLARHCFYRGALAHWLSDVDTMRHFRF